MGQEVSLAISPRNDTLLARLLADAVADDASGGLRSAVLAADDTEGRAAATPGADLLATLTEAGYVPTETEHGDIELLGNGPFDQLPSSKPDSCPVSTTPWCAASSPAAATTPTAFRVELADRPDRCHILIRRP